MLRITHKVAPKGNQVVPVSKNNQLMIKIEKKLHEQTVGILKYFLKQNR